ncbi:DUF2283 domain-containing protein [Wocania ichthyoenteri]|uniref:DUF2283 domain-containing protein n=1 Tax=Wocania ichthyoenteri TaxID=1230531 RepID=UPI00053E4D01|nr:DUF2283 domain-containing protein [Wocania ichthyoenteri]
MKKKSLVLKLSDNSEVGYLYLPNHPGIGVKGASVKQLPIQKLIKGYKGADIYFDFNDKDELIGIEVLD